MSDFPFSDRDVQEFHAKGYAVVPDFFAAHEAATLLAALDGAATLDA